MLRLYIYILSLICSFSVYAQKKESILVSETIQKYMDDMRLNIYIPKNFTMVADAGYECFENNRSLNLSFTCLNNTLVSKNKENIMFIYLDPLFSSEDSILYSKIANKPFNRNLIHANNLKRQIIHLTNDTDNWAQKIGYLETSEAKKGFNADSVMYFQTRLTENQIYENKYNNVISLMIQKKNRGYANVILFYTKDSGLNVRKIIDLLKTNIYYRE